MDPRTLLAKADEFAARKHDGQHRRDGKTPYIKHPRGVMSILRDEFGISDPETLAAGLLHDTIEDTTTDYDDLSERFGSRVADLVAILTKDKRLPELKRERVYFAGLAKAPLAARCCKVADSLYNVRDSDAAHRPKAAKKAKKLLQIYGKRRDMALPLSILRKELSR
jgi:guanosine-3',5'-bis(diphosphate) 3'-pyrophosphohydrolase